MTEADAAPEAREGLYRALEETPARDVAGTLQHFWEEQFARIREAHGRGAGGTVVARQITVAREAVVLGAYRVALRSGPVGSHALVGLGGFGRREMGPHSDVDLLFLFRGARDKAPDLVSGVLHPLWDIGFEIGHSSRTLTEAGRIARQDLASCTSMMDSRLLAGDADLFDQFRQRIYKQIRKGVVSALQKGRTERYHGRPSVQLLEPDVKESPGALREVHILDWALKARAGDPGVDALRREYLDEVDLAVLDRGCEFLWRVRHQLHLESGRRQDVLQQEVKPRIARDLGYEDSGQELGVERFMRDYYLHARAIFHLVELAFERLRRRARSPARSMLLEKGVIAAEGEIVLREGRPFFEAFPLQLLKIFHLAQARDLRLSEPTQRTIRSCLDLIDDEFRRDPAARDLFLRILKRKRRTVGTLRAMHDLGVLGAYLPEFGALTCLVQYDIYHIYTVDEHTLVALENLEALGAAPAPTNLNKVLQEIERRDLLFLALMLHDIGKSTRMDHVVAGTRMVGELLARLDLPEADRRLVSFLVEHHQDMVMMAKLRDLDDNKMIAQFAGLFASQEELRALYLVSYGDLSAVAREAWTEWEEALLWELYHKTGEQLESGIKALEDKQQSRELLAEYLPDVASVWSASKVAAFEEHAAQLPPRYLVAYDQDEISSHLDLISQLGDGVVAVDFAEREAHTQVTICCRDQRQLLAKICGVLAVNDINILRAEVNTRDDDVVLDIFQITDVDGQRQLQEWKKERISERLEQVMAGRLEVDRLFEGYSTSWDRRKKQRLPGRAPQVEFENQVSDKYTVIDTDVQDQVGLLYKITRVLGGLDLDIHTAIVNTAANRAVDAFYVTDLQGEKIVNYEVLEQVRDRLLAELST